MARDERNLKWNNLDQIKLDANVHLSTSAWQQQTGRNGLAIIVLQIIGNWMASSGTYLAFRVRWFVQNTKHVDRGAVFTLDICQGNTLDFRYKNDRWGLYKT